MIRKKIFSKVKGKTVSGNALNGEILAGVLKAGINKNNNLEKIINNAMKNDA